MLQNRLEWMKRWNALVGAVLSWNEDLFRAATGAAVYSPVFEGTMKHLIHSVKTQGLEGLVAKRRDSKYEPGLRSGAWQKMGVNAGQELVIAGYTPSPKNFDALVIGCYQDGKLIYAARTHCAPVRACSPVAGHPGR